MYNKIIKITEMKHKYLVVATSALLALSSCGVTDLTPSDSINDAIFWKTTNDLELYANSFYTNLGGIDAWYDNNTDVRLSNQSSDYFSGAYVAPDADGAWSFSTIRNANYFLTRYQTVVGEQAVINHFVAEVRFFRALEYWNKVKRYGDYPYYDKDLGTSDEELIYKARDPRAFVVGKIIEDLEFACKNLRSKKDVATNRLYDYVAYAQLARVCLYEGTRAKYANDNTFNANELLDKAAKAAKYIMDNGGYSITMDAAPYAPPVDAQHPLNYNAVFAQLSAINNSSECILAREYKQDLLMHNVSRQLEESGSGLTKAMLIQYLCTDGKPIAISPLYKGDDSLNQELTNRDRRLYQTIDNRYLPYKLEKGAIVVNNYPSIGGGSPTGYNFMKLHHSEPTQWIANACWIQWHLYRYAETLLIYAEAKAELGAITQEDVNLTINKLRQRGGVAPLDLAAIEVDPNWPNYGHALTPVLYEVRRERAVELIGEGFRFDDIMRWRAGRLLENPLAVYGCTVTDYVIAKYPGVFDTGSGSGLKLVNYNGKRYIQAYTNNVKNGYTFNDRMYLYPVPKNQISLNPALTQNPGWQQ